jgi:hypothetical protein
MTDYIWIPVLCISLSEATEKKKFLMLTGEFLIKCKKGPWLIVFEARLQSQFTKKYFQIS